jgi:hypothetical protein
LFILLSCVIFAAGAQAQTRPTPSPNVTPSVTREDRELTDARRRNEEAQAEYYRAQTEKLNQPGTSKSFWRTLSDNAAILGALTAALVALATLFINQRTALRARKDTEFYEALKRFGDKDSPTVRATAAGLLARISDTAFFTFPRRRPDWPWRLLQKKWWQKIPVWLKKRVVTHPYFDTALDQLITGLSIEEHPTVVAAMIDAIEHLIPNNSDRAIDQLYIANRRLQIELVEQIAWLSAMFWRDNEKVWKVASSFTGYRREVLEKVPRLHPAEFNVAHQAALLSVGTTDEHLRRPIEDATRQRLKAIGSRLRDNVALLVDSLHMRRDNKWLDLRGVFLAEAKFLEGTKLVWAQLPAALLCDADLSGSNLRYADLTEAHLEGAKLLKVDLEFASLFNTQIDKETKFAGTSWWKASFEPGFSSRRINLDPFSVDRRLLGQLVAQLGELTAEQLTEASLSVTRYMKERKRPPSESSAKIPAEDISLSKPK